MSDSRITHLIQSAASQSAEEASQLAAAIVNHCWPRGGDRHDPVALEWLRRWAPARMPAGDYACACPSGRCAVCN